MNIYIYIQFKTLHGSGFATQRFFLQIKNITDSDSPVNQSFGHLFFLTVQLYLSLAGPVEVGGFQVGFNPMTDPSNWYIYLLIYHKFNNQK